MTYYDASKCVVCGQLGEPLYSDLPDATFGCNGAWSLSRCRNKKCCAVWPNPFPSLDEIGGFYKTYYTHTSSGTQTLKPKTQNKPVSPLRKIAAAISKTPIRFSPELRYLQDKPKGRLLDVGCGNGAFLRLAVAQGWEIFGQEFDPEAAKVAHASTGADIRTGDLLSNNYDADFFDAITLSNVLEHLPNPNEVMLEAHRILKPNGTFVSISPNPNSYLHKRYKSNWRGLEVPRHLFLFPPSALNTLTHNAGFRNIQTFSALGAFEFMERASQVIWKDQSADKPLPASTTKLGRIILKLATILGRDIGEWSVVVAQK